jgi:hypothetical protein
VAIKAHNTYVSLIFVCVKISSVSFHFEGHIIMMRDDNHLSDKIFFQVFTASKEESGNQFNSQLIKHPSLSTLKLSMSNSH